MSATDLAAGIVRTFEGCRLKSYKDIGGIWTIGWGHTGPEVVEGLIWTQEQADMALALDLNKAGGQVGHLVMGRLSDQQLGALISFEFNLGALGSSTLLKLVNGGEFLAATREFVIWDHVSRNEIKGLLKRRLTEALMFVNGS